MFLMQITGCIDSSHDTALVIASPLGHQTTIIMAMHTLYHVSRMSSEHSDWLRALTFYKEELDLLKGRLAEVSMKYTRTEVKAEVEHFQNQFVIQRNNIDELSHDLHEHEKHISRDVQEMAQHLANHTLAEHDSLRDRYFALEKRINELRYEYNRFLARYM